jgi:signal transduction histidine kinase
METTRHAPLATHFAPVERATDDELRREIDACCAHPLLQAVLDAFNGLVLVLNRQRQVLAVNDALLGRLGFDSAERSLGLRPGELLECIHRGDHDGGCGTGEACALCGAANAVWDSQRSGATSRGEFRLTVERGAAIDALELEVVATPLALAGHDITLLSMRDISDSKRVEMLERTFFHDMANTLSGMRGWNDLLVEGATGELGDAARRVHRLVNRLAEQLEYQRAIWRGAAGALEVALEPVSVFGLVEDLQSLLREHPAAQRRRLELPEVSADVELVTDRTLLTRVLTNMLINAFEATAIGGAVRLAWSVDDGRLVFEVWNAGVLPPEVAPQMFTRTFSTKAQRGRGLGTYAMKLFGERYLGGAVRFTSAEGRGTVFSIALPIDGPAPPATAR